MSEGWIKLHRKIWEWPYSSDPDYLVVWLYLLTNATHKERDVLFAGKRICLKPGQLITGRNAISFKTNVSSSKVQRILKTLKSEQQIEQQNSNKNRLITITYWDKYQCSEQQNEPQVNRKRTASEPQVNTNKNVKNNKNEKNEKNTPPNTPPPGGGAFEEFWSAYPNKKGKGQALKAWLKINPDKILTNTIMMAIRDQKDEREFLTANNRFVPEWKNPSTWLNGQCWEDGQSEDFFKLKQNELEMAEWLGNVYSNVIEGKFYARD